MSALVRTLVTTALGVLAFATLLIAWSPNALAATETFGYTGGERTFTVPAGVTVVQVTATGGHGGEAEFGVLGGAAAQVSGELHVVPGETLFVEVGGNGQSEQSGGAGGFNGGGRGGPSNVGAGGGGGATDVRTVTRSQGLSPDSRLIVAGAGGGAGGASENCSGIAPGSVGGPAGEAGHQEGCSNGGGQPGSQTAGGNGTAGGACGQGESGQLGVGGQGSGDGYGGFCNNSTGGGGGAGYYGGAGGSGGTSASGGGGGGGSSLVPEGGGVGLASLSAEPEVQITFAPAALTQQGSKLTATGEVGSGKLGKSVSVSSDGNTAVVGAPADNGSVGAAFIYTRAGSTWTQQAKLTGSGETGAGQFGERVSISGDGNTVVIGAPEDNGKIGAAFVFTRSGSTWTQQGSKLIGAGESGKGTFGSSAAISSDASTIAVGAPANNGGNGEVWVYAHSGSTWTEQAKLTPSDEIGKGKFGASLALSSNGNTSVIGTPADNINAGAGFIFARSGTSWSEQTKLTASGEEGEGHLGTSVALSAAGTTALVGAPEEHSSTGAAYVFTGSGSSWTQQARLTASGEVGSGHFGQSVALSSDGNKALVGAYGDESAAGAAYQFERSGSSWSQLARLTPSGETGAGQFGNVSLSSDASTALIGASADNGGAGAAFVFVIPTAVPTITGVAPDEGPQGGGTSVTITGTNLSAVNSVEFGSTSATSFTVNSATSITATAPAGSGTVDVTVSTSSSTSATSAADRFIYVAAPSVTALSPTSGAPGGGTSVTLTGTNLNGATAVKFGSANAESFTVNASNSITATAPAGTGVVSVTVTTAGGTSAANSGDLYSYEPSVTGISPTSGPAAGGTSVKIIGSNFNEVSAVMFGSTAASSYTVKSPTEITATSPAGSATVDVTVSTAGGTSTTSAKDQFSYIAEAPPAVTKIAPTKGRGEGGTTVKITGTGFKNVTSVKFGSTAATSYAVDSETEVKAVAPAGAGIVDVTVTTTHGTSSTSSGDQFTYEPSITGLSPNHGLVAGGTSVKVTGTGFSLGTGTAFKFGTVAAKSVSCTSTTSCTVTAPAAKKGKAGAVDVVASVGKVKSKKTSADKYTYS